jgi:hypothetical protein
LALTVTTVRSRARTRRINLARIDYILAIGKPSTKRSNSSLVNSSLGPFNVTTSVRWPLAQSVLWQVQFVRFKSPISGPITVVDFQFTVFQKARQRHPLIQGSAPPRPPGSSAIRLAATLADSDQVFATPSSTPAAVVPAAVRPSMVSVL